MSVARPLRAQVASLFLVGAVLASLLIGAAAVSVARADDGTEIGTGLSVAVVSTSPSASTTVGGISTTDAGTATGGAVGSTAGGTTTSGGTPTTSTESGAGVIYVSGLSWSYAPSLNPLDGSLNLRFTVRNLYHETLSPTATLWINQLLGGPVDATAIVPVANLKSGETRTIEATFHGLAQWTMLSAHATLAVPSKAEVVLAPIVRDAIIWFLPWFIVLLVAIGVAAIIWRRLQPRGRRRRIKAAMAQAGTSPGTQATPPGSESP